MVSLTMSLPRDLATTSLSDLEGLIADKTTESSHLEFKRDLPGRDASGRHEFVADVSAFANAGGGDLVYGIDEDGEGQARELVVLTGNVDEEVRRLQDVLLHGAEPRIPGVQFQAIVAPRGFAVVVRVPQSWDAPHRVKTNQHFYIREGARKRQLDVSEIRNLFLRSGERAQHVRNFRTDRLGKLLAGEGPPGLVAGPLLVVHFVPMEAVLGSLSIDPVPYSRGRYLPMPAGASRAARLNLDGAISVNLSGDGRIYGYSQLFRSGYFESVKAYGASGSTTAGLPSRGYEEQVIKLLTELRAELAHLGVNGQLTCLLSLLRVKGLKLGVDRLRVDPSEDDGFFDRDTIALPDIVLACELAPAEALKPVFDLVWQSAGFARSYNYNEAGQWARGR